MQLALPWRISRVQTSKLVIYNFFVGFYNEVFTSSLRVDRSRKEKEVGRIIALHIIYYTKITCLKVPCSFHTWKHAYLLILTKDKRRYILSKSILQKLMVNQKGTLMLLMNHRSNHLDLNFEHYDLYHLIHCSWSWAPLSEALQTSLHFSWCWNMLTNEAWINEITI